MLEGLELNKVSADKLCDDLRSGLDMHYSARDIQISPALMAIIEGALERGIEVAAICAMPEKTAETVMKNTGLADKGVQLFSYDDVEETFPRADIWMKIANSLSIGTRCCLVLASSAVACKSALSAGMRCLALPDVFTAFQDFGGAEQVMDDLGEVPTNELLDTLFPA
jgi:beta-phosphoglucomutase-like phosphatase (HAD superfamily)